MTCIIKCPQLPRFTIYTHGIFYWKLLIIVIVCLTPRVQTKKSKNCESTNGTRQSPINIDISAAKPIKAKRAIVFSKGYTKSRTYSLENTGHTIQLNELSQNGMNISGGPIQGPYQLRQLHVHLPSEHTLNNKSYAMELHAVHEQTTNKDVDQFVVLTYGFKITRKNNPLLTKILDAIPTIEQKGESTKIQDFTLTDLIGSPPRQYYVYEGSLTTSPYTESVLWIIKSRPLRISQKQIDVFYKAAKKTPGLVNNNRCVQDLNGRQVYLFKYQ